MALYNRTDKRILKQKLHSTTQERVTLSFYRYHHIIEPLTFRNDLYRDWMAMDVLGRTYIALEGINAQISVPKENWEAFKNHLYNIPFLKDVRLNIAVEDNGKSFFKLKINVRKKIVADGLDEPNFDVTHCGQHVNAEEFNKLAEHPDTLIVDMRNHYESEVGRFKNAICPDVDTFREELQAAEDLMKGHKDKNLLMYCTGGIRCEKASAWMRFKGFQKVYQLDGGIINYAKQVKERGLENKFIGKNFVFDERLSEKITDDILSTCHQCGKPSDTHTNCKEEGCHLLFIQCTDCAAIFEGCCSVKCQEIVKLPAEVQKELRRGKAQGRKVYKKGRVEHLRT